ncbi:hypothetical protein BN2497_3125 [Janthinobacterium sp. CG23_2]|nr:hypothetical protein BN2497_3125 [Janthinobacterium sp. CG23_2]CUU27960.1 hypothetical protein BN3177_3125 [Janthinobacterium sp. CG23_2]
MHRCTREIAFFSAVTTFAVISLASPMSLFFDVADLPGGMWTHVALKADSQAAAPFLAGRH